MVFYKFQPNDKFYNRIKTYPEINFKIYDGKVYYNDDVKTTGSFVDNVGGVPTGYIDLYENNINRPSGQRIYPFIRKQSSLLSFKTISLDSFNSDFAYSDIVSGSYPLSASISIVRYTSGEARLRINALENTLNRYLTLSTHYEYSSSLGNKSSQPLKLISIPSIFYGSSIEKGSISCKFYVTGVLAAEIVDERRNGELRQKLPADANSGTVAGVALYNEGFLLLTSSWSIHPTHTEGYDIYDPGVNISPSWLYFGTTGSTTPSDLTNVASSSFEMSFNGINYIPVLTMFAHAPKGELNFSNNPTFIKYGQTGSLTPMSSSKEFKEKDDLEIKNIIKSNFIEPTASFQQAVYINKIGIYDKDKNLIGVVKLANSYRKKIDESISFKIKLDF